jgi:hypothetical protein
VVTTAALPTGGLRFDARLCIFFLLNTFADSIPVTTTPKAPALIPLPHNKPPYHLRISFLLFLTCQMSKHINTLEQLSLKPTAIDAFSYGHT